MQSSNVLQVLSSSGQTRSLITFQEVGSNITAEFVAPLNVSSLAASNINFSGALTFNNQPFTGPAGPTGASAPKSISVQYPASSESFTIMYTMSAVTIFEVDAVITGGTSVVYSLVYGANRSLAGTTITGPNTVSTTTTAAVASVANVVVPSGNFVWVNLGTVTGSVPEFHLTIEFT